MDIDFYGLSALIGGRVSKEIEEKRWNHCKDCTFLIKMSRCKKCGCFMKMKVKFKEAEFPIGIWGKTK